MAMADTHFMNDLPPTQRFSNRVDFYQRSRPGYPQALLELFRSELGLDAADPVADVASGTGMLTQLLVHNGNPTFAVEPNAEMRAAAEAQLGRAPNFHSVAGTAEATTLGDQSVRLITIAQAFHWVNPIAAGAEFRRILTPDGFAAIVWNDRLHRDSPFVRAYDALCDRHLNGVVRRAKQFRGEERGAMDAFFGTGGYAERRFDNPQRLDRAGLLDRITSSSYMPVPGEAGYETVARDSDALFHAFQSDGVVTIRQETLIYFGRLS